MSVTLATPHVARAYETLKMRPISPSLTIRPLQAPHGRLTVRRRDPVGEPTKSPSTGTIVAIGRDAQETRDDRRPVETPAPLPTTALVREAIDTALDSLDALEHQARDVARRFRRQALDEAHTGLAHLVQSTRTLLELAAMTADATGTDIETVCETHGLAAEAETHQALACLIGRQLEHDWHGLARVIERSFVALFATWRLVFEALGGPTHPYGHAA